MLKRVSVVWLAALAVLALGALAAGTASAKRAWWVKGERLPAGVEKTITAKTKPGSKWVLEGTILGVKATVECEQIEATGKGFYNSTAETGDNYNSIGFKVCKSSAGCSVTEPIKMPPKIEGEGVLVENVAKTKIYEDMLPEEVGAKRVFAEIELGGFCPKKFRWRAWLR